MTVADPYSRAEDWEELRARLTRGVTLSKLTTLTIVCRHQRALVRVLRLNGHDCLLYIPYEGAKNMDGAGLDGWRPEFAGERLLRLSDWHQALSPINECCATERVELADVRRLLASKTRRAAVHSF